MTRRALDVEPAAMRGMHGVHVLFGLQASRSSG
jgi:hypothetical protein